LRNIETNSTAANGMEPLGTHAARNSRMTALARHRLNISRARKIGMFTERMEITPEFAAVVLEHFAPVGTNRRLRRGAVDELVMQMKGGRWDRNTHQGIAFAPDGILNDGQHRLTAAAESGVTISLPVTYGQPRETFMAIDVAHTSRTPADLMQIAGLQMTSANNVAATARMLVALDREKIMSYTDATRSADYADIVDYAKRHVDELNESVKRARRIAQHVRSRVSVTALSAALLLIRRASTEDRVSAFCDFLATGHDLPKNSPLLVLREAFRAGIAGGNYRNSQDRLRGAAAAVVMAWNLWRKGASARSFRALTVETRDAFPAPRA